MVFVADATTGEPVPYLPVTAVIRAQESAARTVRLQPMIGAPAPLRRRCHAARRHDEDHADARRGGGEDDGAEAARFRKPVTLSFDWSD